MLRFLLSLSLILTVSATALPNAEAFPQPPNIKGLQVQMTEDALTLGLHHAAINLNLSALFTAPQGEGAALHFNEHYLESLDRQILPLSDAGMLVYTILLTYPTKDVAKDAVLLHPGHRADYKFSIGAFNNVTPVGRAWLTAATEMLAERWSGAHPEHGRVWGWIIGNEVNSHFLWYNLGNAALPEVVQAYTQAFRIMHEAVRKHSTNARLYVPFDHHWAISMHNVNPLEAKPGRDFLDEFAQQIRAGGDLDWHVAWHPYPEDLGNPRAWLDKSITTDDDTPKVTFKNLQVLAQHLQRPGLLWAGQSRRIILSEQGFQTLPTPDGPQLQAAAYAYAWEKCQRVRSVDAFILHRHVDHAGEGGLNLGLWTHQPNTLSTPGEKKLLYTLFQKAGTPDWPAAAAFALPIVGLENWDVLGK